MLNANAAADRTGTTKVRDQEAPAHLSQLELPRRAILDKTSGLSPTAPQPSEQGQPSSGAGGNPTNTELRKEQWLFRTGLAAIGVGVGGAVLSVLTVDPLGVARRNAFFLLLNSAFSQLALKESETRTAVINGDTLPRPVHSDPVSEKLLTLGIASYLLGALGDVTLSGVGFLLGDYPSGVVRGALALTELYLLFAWLRQRNFYKRMDSE